MTRIALAIVLVAFLSIGVATRSGAARPTASLQIRAVGADMEFRTLGLPTDAFTLAAGQSRTFRRLPPGTYIVVQAPPVGAATQVGPDQWEITGGLQIQCSDDVSANQYDLEAGENLVCSYIAA